MNDRCLTAFVKQELGALPAPESGCIVAAALVRPAFTYDHLRLLSRSEREQYNFWFSSTDTWNLEGRLFFFDVLDVWPFASQPAHIPNVKSAFVSLEEGQPSLLKQSAVSECSAPPWVTDLSTTCVRLPGAYSLLCGCGVWKRFAVADVGRTSVRRNGVWPELRLEFPEVSHVPISATFDASLAQSVADDIRTRAVQLDRSDDMECEQLVVYHRWCSVLQQMSDELGPSGWHRRVLDTQPPVADGGYILRARAYNTTFLVRALLLSSMLRNAANLRRAVRQALQIVLPPALSEPLLDQLSDEASLIPSPSTLSRVRFCVDTAYMSFMSSKWALMFGKGTTAVGAVFYFMCDSSPQGHRDFELISMTWVSRGDLAQLAEVSKALYALTRSGVEDEVPQDEDFRLIDQGRVCMQRHHMPAVVLGSGRTDHASKYHAFIHALFWSLRRCVVCPTLFNPLSALPQTRAWNT